MSDATTFFEALEGAHPNADVRLMSVGSKTHTSYVDNAGHIAREWRAAQSEIMRLRTENESLTRIVSTLTEA